MGVPPPHPVFSRTGHPPCRFGTPFGEFRPSPMGWPPCRPGWGWGMRIGAVTLSPTLSFFGMGGYPDQKIGQVPPGWPPCRFPVGDRDGDRAATLSFPDGDGVTLSFSGHPPCRSPAPIVKFSPKFSPSPTQPPTLSPTGRGYGALGDPFRAIPPSPTRPPTLSFPIHTPRPDGSHRPSVGDSRF